jgi:hypothetical protein
MVVERVVRVVRPSLGGSVFSLYVPSLLTYHFYTPSYEFLLPVSLAARSDKWATRTAADFLVPWLAGYFLITSESTRQSNEREEAK